MNDWNKIRGYYRAKTHAIYAAGRNDWADDPYSWEHECDIKLTPIERALWSDIRSVGVVMYPQYPVSRYFVDFANPVARVAIECDGAAYHVDKAKDERRDKELRAQGWEVYRISGSDCMKNTDYEEDEYGRRTIVLSPAYALIRDIADRHNVRYAPPREHRSARTMSAFESMVSHLIE